MRMPVVRVRHVVRSAWDSLGPRPGFGWEAGLRRCRARAQLLPGGRQHCAQACEQQDGCGQHDSPVPGRVGDGEDDRLPQVMPAGEADGGGVDGGDNRQRAAAPDPREHPQAHGDGGFARQAADQPWPPPFASMITRMPVNAPKGARCRASRTTINATPRAADLPARTAAAQIGATTAVGRPAFQSPSTSPSGIFRGPVTRTSPTATTSAPKVTSPSTSNRWQRRSDGAPPGNRWSKSGSSL